MILGDEIVGVMVGMVFLLPGLACCVIAGMRRGNGARALMWLGLWSAMYGARPLADSLSVLGVVPKWFQAVVPYVDKVSGYMIIVVASLATLELSVGKFRVWIKAVLVAGLAIGVAGIAKFVVTGSSGRATVYNQLLATCLLLMLLVVVVVPKLSRKYLMLPAGDHRVLAVGTLLFVIEALWVNASRPFGYKTSSLWDAAGFAVLLLSFAYVALQMMFANERRLLSIESELAIAREIQNSILPSSSPELENLRVSAAYRPMMAVAGDFYEFVPIDQSRVGFLVADVSGHGVPAALIAGMIKVAIKSILSCAENPGEVLRELNRILSGQLRDQFVTAAYLLMDTQKGKALYSAAGHPPLLRWRAGKLERIESNGIVFGMVEEPEYPVREMDIHAGDRFVLYTDGVIEPENARGEAFGDGKLEQVICSNQARSSSVLVDQLLVEIQRWRPESTSQQDDITVIVIDVV